MSGDLEPRPKREVEPLVPAKTLIKFGAVGGLPLVLMLSGHLLFALLFVAAYVVGRIDSGNGG